jgi:hypothetical protein
MSAYSETVNVIMKSRVRKSRTHGSVRGWHREVPVYSTVQHLTAADKHFTTIKSFWYFWQVIIKYSLSQRQKFSFAADE